MEYAKLAKTIRKDILTMIYEAQSGHPGGSLSCVEMLIALFYEVMQGRDPKDPQNPHRDRFVLSKGHAAPAMYAVLCSQKYFSKREYYAFRQADGILQGHPDMHKTPGVDFNTGSLGQGAAISMGMALAGKTAKEDYKVYAVLGDGECQEGIVWEAAMAASKYKLDNLTWLLDHNGLQIDGKNDDVMPLGDIKAKFAAFGFEVYEVDGHDVDAIVAACNAPSNGKPKFIECHTVKGKGVSFMENNAGWHGKAPNEEQYEAALEELEG